MAPENEAPPAGAGFQPSTGHLDGVGPPPPVPETQVESLSAETVAAFHRRAEEAAIRVDLREKLLDLLTTIGEAAARRFLGV